MKVLNREGIIRMTGNHQGGAGGVNIGDMFGGYASQLWVNQNYVSIDFFKRLFTAWGPAETSGDPDVEVEPNDLNSTITNIKAMVGTWTEEYLSALGMSSTGGGGGGGSTALYDLLDVKPNAAGDGVYGAATGKVLTYGSDGKWYAADATAGSVTSIGMTVPTGFTVSPSSITSHGVFTIGFGGSITKNYVLASPSNAAGAPSWRALVTSDIPDLSSIYYTKTEADAKFMTIAAFENLFNALNSSSQKVSHPYSSGVASIKALKGLWTEQFLTALGQGSSGGGSVAALSDLTDANISNPQNGQVLKYNGTKWVNSSVTPGSVTSVGMTVPTGFSVSPSSITSSGTFAISFGGSISANCVLATPSNASGSPSWRVLVAADIPNLAASKITSGTLDTARIPDLSGTYATTGRVTTLEGYFDASGNAKSALKLTTVSKTAWGQTYWTSDGVPDTISGNMTNVGNISFSASGKNIGGFLYFDTTNSRIGVGESSPSYALDVYGNAQFGNHSTRKVRIGSNANYASISLLTNGGTSVGMITFGDSVATNNYLRIGNGGYTTYLRGSTTYFTYGSNDTTAMMIASDGNVGIGTTSPSYLLHVNGYAYTTRLYLSSGVYFEYNSGNSGVKLVGAGLYTDSYFTALGTGSSGSGSTTALNDLTDVTISSAANGNVLAYNGTKWVNSNALSVNSVTVNGNVSVAQKVSTTSASVSAYMAIGQSTLDTNYNLYVNGTARVNDLVMGENNSVNTVTCATIRTLSSHGLYIKTGTAPNFVDGTWTNASDIRLKDVISDVEVSINDIANAPIFNYKWKNGDGTVMLGTKAQHWVNVFPSAVPEGPDGYLFMDYSATALAAAVMTARKVVTHEEKIAQLENRVEEVEKENLQLKDIINHLKGTES